MVVAGVAGAVTDAKAQDPTVTLTVSPTRLAEGGGGADVAVTATLSATRAGPTTVALSLGGTATAPGDYTVLPSPLPSITIPAGDTAHAATLIVSTVDDTIYEGAESIEVSGSAGGLTVTGASLTLEDNDQAPEIRIAYQFTRLHEDTPGPQTTRLEATLHGGATLPEDTIIRLSLSGAATRGADYTVTPDPLPSITIPAGRTSAERTDLTFTVVDDDQQDPGESIYINGFATDHLGGSLRVVWIQGSRQTSSLQIEIRDDDLPPRIALSWNLHEALFLAEGTSRKLTVTATVPANVDTPLGISFTANSNELMFTPGTLVIPRGQRTASVDVTFTAAADTTFEEPKTVFFTSSAVGYRDSLGLPVVIYDAPSGGSVTVQRIVVSEGGSPKVLGNIFDWKVDFSRPFRTTGGRPHLIMTLDSGRRSVACNPHTGRTGRLLCYGDVQEGDVALDGIRIGPNALDFSGVQAFGLDDEDGSTPLTVTPAIPAAFARTYDIVVYGQRHSFRLLLSRQSLQEGSGATELTVTATLQAGPTPTSEITIPLVFRDVTTSAADYLVSGTPTVTVAAGMRSGSGPVTVTPVDDQVKENRIETVVVEGGTSTAFVTGAELHIIDAPSIELSVSPARVTENGGAQTVTVMAALGDPSDSVRPRASPVALTLAGTADAGEYAVAGALVVTIPAYARSGSATLTVTPVNDRLLEGDETIVLRGSTPGLAVDEATLTLVDDESLPQVILSVDDDTILESETGATAVAVTAVLDPSVTVSADTVVTLDLGGTATAGGSGDYTVAWAPAAQQIRIPAGQVAGAAPVTLTLTPRQDNVAEG